MRNFWLTTRGHDAGPHDIAQEMMKSSRRLGRSAAAALFMLAVTFGTAHADDSQLKRGDYLINGIVACGNCHTPKSPDGRPLQDRELSGGVVIDLPVFHAVAPNITPDNETGIGRWTDEQIVNAIRNGKRPDGTTIGPPMPVSFYRSMSDSDVLAIVTYLRAVKPISHLVEKSTFKIASPESYGPTVVHVADVLPDDKLSYGKYLADIAHCMECHTPMTRGRLDTTRLGAGGRELPAFPDGVVVSANLTPANPDGIVKWTDAQVKDAITKGVRPDGRQLVLLMAFDWYKHITPTDLAVLVGYLRTLKPAKP
jgi:mono/diheme cytochrome c family protein